MADTFWRKQTLEEPLFKELLWSRPENKRLAGKLLIIGGSVHGFAAPAEAYGESVKAGGGAARVILPDAIRTHFPHFQGGTLEMEFAPSNPSGGFDRKSLAEFLAAAAWADGVLLAGDFGRNSETAIALEQFAQKHQGQLTLTKDAVDYFSKTPEPLLQRPETTLVLSFAQLQQLAKAARFTPAFTFSMDMMHLVEALHELSERYQTGIITKHLENIFVAYGGQVSSTKLETDEEIWRVKTAGHAAVWWLQNPTKTFEALTTSTYDPLKNSEAN